MRVCITGVTSFVGYHLAAGLDAEGFDVVGLLGRQQHDGIMERRVQLLQGRAVPLEHLDLTDPAAIERCVQRLDPQIWIQHAGYTKAYASDDYDLDAGFEINVEPLKALFSAMARATGGVIVTGTVSEYGDSAEPHVENEACMPGTPYGLSKLMETLYAAQLAQHFGINTRIARIFLPFGPLDNPEKLLSSLATSLRKEQRISLSPGTQRRDFVHVDDVVAAYRALIDDLQRSRFEIYNVCSGESPALRDVILALADAIGADRSLCEFGAIPVRSGEAPVIRGSNAKARELLHWSPMPWREAVTAFAASV